MSLLSNNNFRNTQNYILWKKDKYMVYSYLFEKIRDNKKTKFYIKHLLYIEVLILISIIFVPLIFYWTVNNFITLYLLVLFLWYLLMILIVIYVFYYKINNYILLPILIKFWFKKFKTNIFILKRIPIKYDIENYLIVNKKGKISKINL